MENKIETKNLSLWYGKLHALKGIHLGISKNSITAIIGPSGCGKSTFLRTLNRMNEEIQGCLIQGEVFLDRTNIFDKTFPLSLLRKRVAMVFQRPNPFPASIFDNVSFGPLLHRLTNTKSELKERVSSCLIAVGLSDLQSSLDKNALKLSLEQQQRLCIARAIATEPEVLLLDEPCSALDPVATAKIEELIVELKDKLSIVIVTYNMQQAARVSDYTAFFYLGQLIEHRKTKELFTNPKESLTEKYVSGHYG